MSDSEHKQNLLKHVKMNLVIINQSIIPTKIL